MNPAETIVLRGRVIDTNGDALPGVTVQMTGTSTGVVTDANGKFSISLPKGQPSTVVFSYIGMKNETYACNGKKDANVVIRMQEDASQINEVVVTGIVTKRKETFTGSSSSFSGEELKSVSVQNPIAALKALDPAFNVMDDNLFGSDPNRMPNIEIRGKSSVLGMRDELSEDPNQPLFILDGFESSLEAIYNLDINRIASMTLLKDAASTAIYGSKAANGVVVVETIKPKAGQTKNQL